MAPSPPPDPGRTVGPETLTADVVGSPLAQVAQLQMSNYVALKQRQLNEIISKEEEKTETKLQHHLTSCLDAINYLGPSSEAGKEFKAGILAHFPGDEDLGHLAYKKVMHGAKERGHHWDIIDTRLREILDILDVRKTEDDDGAQEKQMLETYTKSSGELPTPVSPRFSGLYESALINRKRPPQSPARASIFVDEKTEPINLKVASNALVSKRPRIDEAPVASMSPGKTGAPTSPASPVSIERRPSAGFNAEKFSMKRTGNKPRNKLPGKQWIRPVSDKEK